MNEIEKPRESDDHIIDCFEDEIEKINENLLKCFMVPEPLLTGDCKTSTQVRLGLGEDK